jgi:hypothetical protein
MRNSYVRDTVILIIGYNRPELISKRLVNASSLRDRNIKLSLDFHTEETLQLMHEVVSTHKRTIEEFNKFEVKFNKVNLGLAQHVSSAISEALSIYENVIVIEDDIDFNLHSIASVDFGLTLMKKNPFIGSVGMYSPLNFSSTLGKRNFFRYSRYFSCWGWGTNRNVWSRYQLDISKKDLSIKLPHSNVFNSMPKKLQETWLGRFNKLKSNTFHTWDVQFQLMAFEEGFLHLVPVGTIANNEGFDDLRSTHTKGRQPFWMINRALTFGEISILNESRLIQRIMELIESYTSIGIRRIPTRLINLRSLIGRKGI